MKIREEEEEEEKKTLEKKKMIQGIILTRFIAKIGFSFTF